MDEYLAYVLGMGRCLSCGAHIAFGEGDIIIYQDDTQSAIWHADHSPFPKAEIERARYRAMAPWN